MKQVGGGRIEVEADLTVPGHPNVYVVGDLMSRDKLAGVAEVAMQGGRHAGARIAATVENGVPSRKPFKYRDLGTAAYISRRHALLQAGRSVVRVHRMGVMGNHPHRIPRRFPQSRQHGAELGRNPGVENASGTGNHVRRPRNRSAAVQLRVTQS